MSDLVRGDVLLHDKHAIGLNPIESGIGLHRIGGSGWMIGIDAIVSSENYQQQESSGPFLTILRSELLIPAASGNYTGRIEGWDSYREEGYIEYFKPEESQLLPNHPEYITFANLDAHEEIDPYFYYGWGIRSDSNPPIGDRYRKCLAYFGVNYPKKDGTRPPWGDVPNQAALKDLLKPTAPGGDWTLKADIRAFSASSETSNESGISFTVWQGQRRFHEDAVGYIIPGDYTVGVKEVDWTGISWSSIDEFGYLKMISGMANGLTLRVTGSFFTGDNPPIGYPSNTWFLNAIYGIWPPSALGIVPGDRFVLSGPYDMNSHRLLFFREEFGAGMHSGRSYSFNFTPVI